MKYKLNILAPTTLLCIGEVTVEASSLQEVREKAFKEAINGFIEWKSRGLNGIDLDDPEIEVTVDESGKTILKPYADAKLACSAHRIFRTIIRKLNHLIYNEYTIGQRQEIVKVLYDTLKDPS